MDPRTLQALIRTGRGALEAAVMVVALSCAAREPKLITVPDPKFRPVFFIDEITDDRTAVATVAAIVERDLGFPSLPVTFRFYPGRTAFEGALIESGHTPALARSASGTMAAVGGHRAVILNSAALDEMIWPARIGLLAHEFGHTLQYELGGGRRGTSHQWLREGFADYLAVRVLERLGATEMAAVRRDGQRTLQAAGRANIPRLDALVTYPQWVVSSERFKSAQYALSFLAVDALLARHGVAVVTEYFRRFATSEDRTANFRAAFGEGPDTFEATLRARLGIATEE